MRRNIKVLIAFFWSRSGVLLPCAQARQAILNWIYGGESIFYFRGVFTAQRPVPVFGLSWPSIWYLTEDRYTALAAVCMRDDNAKS